MPSKSCVVRSCLAGCRRVADTKVCLHLRLYASVCAFAYMCFCGVYVFLCSPGKEPRPAHAASCRHGALSRLAIQATPIRGSFAM